MILEDEQKALLAKFVEAHRSAPQDSRGEFLVHQTVGSRGDDFIHLRVRGLHFKGSVADAAVLAQAGFLRMSYTDRGDSKFYVLPAGIEYYEQLKHSQDAIASIEDDLNRYLSSSEFKSHHDAAFTKWSQAAHRLWSADSERESTVIGHLCREALQDFAESLAQQHRIDVVHLDKAKSVARVKAVLSKKEASLGDTEAQFLNVLVEYWGAVADLAQRQEHGGQREAKELVWEDARRLVFQTCIVMYEVHRALA